MHACRRTQFFGFFTNAIKKTIRLSYGSSNKSFTTVSLSNSHCNAKAHVNIDECSLSLRERERERECVGEIPARGGVELHRLAVLVH